MQNVQVLLQPTEMDTQPGPLEQRGQRADVVGAEHDIDPRRAAQDLAAVLLREAAADGDLHVGFRRLDRGQLAEIAVQLVVGVLPDRAGVEHHDVGCLALFGRRVPGLLEQSGQSLRVVHVHLAAVGADLVGARLVDRLDDRLVDRLIHRGRTQGCLRHRNGRVTAVEDGGTHALQGTWPAGRRRTGKDLATRSAAVAVHPSSRSVGKASERQASCPIG